ncbi:MAG TPA: hypothetical protein VMP10_00310 [Chloroflexota bacterium]|nr:hypothetical protein [Chloroflexota bacterium]
MSPRTRPRDRRHWFERLARRVMPAAVAAFAVFFIPLPIAFADILASLRLPFGVVLVVGGLGKALYDTFFYDRYSP